MSVALSARRTCSGPELISTTRLAAAAMVGCAGAGGSTVTGTGSAAVPVITSRPSRCGQGRATRSPAARRDAAPGKSSALFPIRFGCAAPRHGVKFQTMPDQLVAELVGDVLLQFLDLLVAELDDPAALQIDQVIVMRAGHFLVARASVAEIVPRQDVGLLEQPHRTIHRGDADARVDLGSAPIDLLDIGVIGRIRQHARDHTTLLSHL